MPLENLIRDTSLRRFRRAASQGCLLVFFSFNNLYRAKPMQEGPSSRFEHFRRQREEVPVAVRLLVFLFFLQSSDFLPILERAWRKFSSVIGSCCDCV
mmetsp:Transcript_14629/g.25391  ORF Transcript_14629/g.25391 Transcript_14629/m.25391 type:complete len:98 (-) Transcript_14629:71-364(-)